MKRLLVVALLVVLTMSLVAPVSAQGIIEYCVPMLFSTVLDYAQTLFNTFPAQFEQGKAYFQQERIRVEGSRNMTIWEYATLGLSQALGYPPSDPEILAGSVALWSCNGYV